MPELDDAQAELRAATELRRVREAAGLTMEQMASRLGMGYAPGGRRVSTGRAAVSAWEAGKRRPPPEYLKIYIEHGGDPAILTACPALADSATETAKAEATPDPAAAASQEPAANRLSRSRWRRPAIAATTLFLGGALTVFLTTRHDGPNPTTPTSTWTETTGTPAHTWADPIQLTGAGTPLGPRQSVQIACRVRGYVVPDGDPWWYLIASGPWGRKFYATSDAFYNNGATTGPVDTGVVVDEQVPVCPGTPAVATAG